MKALVLTVCGAALLFWGGVRGQSGEAEISYNVLAPVTQGNLTVFPVIADFVRDTKGMMTLDEGLRSGQVVITENGGAAGLQRRRPGHEIWPERPAPGGATVNQLALVNNSGRPLLLLAGEIVTGGKQDRVVG